jgi:hypothetical protein
MTATFYENYKIQSAEIIDCDFQSDLVYLTKRHLAVRENGEFVILIPYSRYSRNNITDASHFLAYENLKFKNFVPPDEN